MATKARKGKGMTIKHLMWWKQFSNKIKPQLELINLALSQKEKGKSILAEFIASCGLNIVNKAPTLEKPCAAFEGGIFQSV